MIKSFRVLHCFLKIKFVEIMKKIKIKYLDFWPGFKPEEDLLYQILTEIPDYDVEISNSPDYIVYSVFGYEHLEYDCVRILYSGEEFCPDFNICDYGVGFEYLSFGDRYFRLPLLYEPLYSKDYFHMMNRPTSLDKSRGFCSFVYSNAEADPIRTTFFKKLSNYKKIASGGKLLNNVGGPVENKLEFEKKYKFSMAFENVSHPGYISEKLLQSFAAGGIPIYWGDPKVTQMFNGKAFVNINDFESLDKAIEFITYLDCDDKEYEKMLNERPLLAGYEIESIKHEYELFVRKIFDQDLSQAKRTTRKVFNENYTRQMKNKEELYQIMSPVRKIRREIRKIFIK